METKRLVALAALVLAAAPTGCAQSGSADRSASTATASDPRGSATQAFQKEDERSRAGRFISVAAAVRRLQPHVDVPVVLPRDGRAGLPSLEGWLADTKYLDWQTNDGIRTGTMKLRKGNQILILTYGLAGFDGCGGRDHAIETNVLGRPGLVTQAREHLWSHVIWPVTETGSTGRYGITGTFEGWAMVRLAESMEVARIRALDSHRGC